MPENNSIFRKKSLERVTSPEQLNDYIRVATPGAWMILLAIVIFLVGMIIWGAVGRLETKVRGAAVISDGSALIYVSEQSAANVKEGQTVRANGAEFTVRSISQKPVELDSSADSYLVHAGGFEEDEWVYTLTADAPAAEDGTYQCEVVTDSVSPLSFIMN